MPKTNSEILKIALEIDSKSAARDFQNFLKKVQSSARSKSGFEFFETKGVKKAQQYRDAAKETSRSLRDMQKGLQRAGVLSKAVANQAQRLNPYYSRASKSGFKLAKEVKKRYEIERKGKEAIRIAPAKDRAQLRNQLKLDIAKQEAAIEKAAKLKESRFSALSKEYRKSERSEGFKKGLEKNKRLREYAGKPSHVNYRSMHTPHGFLRGVQGMTSNLMKSVMRSSFRMIDKGGFGGKVGALAVKAMSPMVSIGSALSNLLGPLELLGGGLVKLAMMLLEAESYQKQFNKDILDSSGAMGYLKESGGDAGKAGISLSKTLGSIRDQAFSLDSLKTGINDKDYTSTLAGFGRGGVDTAMLKDQLSGVDRMSNSIRNFGDVVKVSVAYSRQFGVSLDEVTSLQSEMITEMGQNVKDLGVQFGKMAKDSLEAGIAGNKFFSIIRSVSSDLALYHNRLEQVTTTLKALGKVMGPQSASKFLQGAVKGLKDLSDEDRLKLSLMADETGGKARSIAQRDAADKIAYAVQQTIKAVSSKMNIGEKGAQDLLSKGYVDVIENGKMVRKEFSDLTNQAGSLTESFLVAQRMLKSLSEGGLGGLGEAMENLSVGAAHQLKVSAALGVLNKLGRRYTSLSEVTGVDAMAVKKATGITSEDFIFNQSLERQRKRLLEESPDGEAYKRSGLPLGLTGKDRIQAIQGASYDQILRSMESSAEEGNDTTQTIEQISQTIAGETKGILERFGELINIIKQDVLSRLDGIKDAIANFSIWGSNSNKGAVSLRDTEEFRDKVAGQYGTQFDKNESEFRKKASQEASQGYNELMGQVDQISKKISKAAPSEVGGLVDEREALLTKRDMIVKKLVSNLSSGDTRSLVTNKVASLDQLQRPESLSSDQVQKILDLFFKSAGKNQVIDSLLDLPVSKKTEGSQPTLLSSAGAAIDNATGMPVSSAVQAVVGGPGGSSLSKAAVTTAESTSAIQGTLRQGIPWAPSVFPDLKDSMLEALRKSNLENWVLNQQNPKDVLESLSYGTPLSSLTTPSMSVAPRNYTPNLTNSSEKNASVAHTVDVHVTASPELATKVKKIVREGISESNEKASRKQ